MFATLHIKPGQTPRLINAGWQQDEVERLLGVPLLEGNAIAGEEVIGALKSRRAVERMLTKRGVDRYIEINATCRAVRS